MGILGDDGDGYELAVRLENCAAWREWLGAASHAELLPHLSSPSAWHSFMNSSSALLTLQMRVRALLFDRVAGCLFPGDNANRAFHATGPSSLPSSFLQLDANGVYFPLEQDAEDWKCWQADGSSIRPILPIKHDVHPVDNSIGTGEESRHGKVAPSTSVQQRPLSQGGQTFANLISPKQERHSLNKAKKLEAWDSSDAKRPMEMVGTISKKMRSPKVSSKISFQGDPMLTASNRDHSADKMAINRSPPAFRVMTEEPKYSAIGIITGAGRNGNLEHAEGGGLWYDRCLDKHLVERMKRVAHRVTQQKLPFKEQDACLRTREGMAAFYDQLPGKSTKVGVGGLGADSNARAPNCGSVKPSEDGNKFKDSIPMYEFRFLENSVPDNPVPAPYGEWLDSNVKGRGSCHELAISPRHANGCMKGRQPPAAKGDRDSIVKHELGLFSGSSKSVESLNKLEGHDAHQMMQQAVAKAVARAGFDGYKQASMDILCDLMGCHIRKLGLGLKAFIDNCCKHGSQTEILNMYMQSSGMSVKDLIEHRKSGARAETQVATQGSPKLANQRRRPVSAQLPTKEIGPRQSPGVASPIQQIQPSFSDKSLKRRQPSNLGRSKKADKEKPVVEGKSAGEGKMDALLATRGMKSMQMSPHLHQQQSPWRAQVPLVQSQPGSVLQNYKQQLSSLQQL